MEKIELHEMEKVDSDRQAGSCFFMIFVQAGPRGGLKDIGGVGVKLGVYVRFGF